MSIFSFLYENDDDRIRRHESEIQVMVERMVYLLNNHALPYHILKDGVFEPGYRWRSPIFEIEYDDLNLRFIGRRQSLYNAIERRQRYWEGVRREGLIND